VEPADAQAVQAIYAPFVSDNATSFETVVPDLAEIRRRIEAQHERYPWLVFEANRGVVGYAYASVYVERGFYRRGVGRALYLALFDLLRRQRFVNAYAGITLPNPSSVGLHESLGFEPIGVYRRVGFKFDRWHDVAWLHLRLREDPGPPADPSPAASLWHEPGVLAMLDERAQFVRLGSTRGMP
jgi:L-amino acid N-acyltransferase YncA